MRDQLYATKYIVWVQSKLKEFQSTDILLLPKPTCVCGLRDVYAEWEFCDVMTYSHGHRPVFIVRAKMLV